MQPIKEGSVAIDQAEEQQAPEGAAGKAQEVAAQAKGQVLEQADRVKGTASVRLREQLDTRSNQLGDQVSSFGQALRAAAEHLQGQDKQSGAKAAHQAADQAERLAGYLTSSGSDRFLGDLESFGRKRPWLSAGIGAALGFVGARFLKASSERRYDSSRRAQQDADMPLSRDTDAGLPAIATPEYGSR
jgi:ElaB/YqjD/DUF883 family membrane-anchored ribosome-binding protein